MSSSLHHSLTNNNSTTDDEEHRINLLFPKCKLRNSQEQSYFRSKRPHKYSSRIQSESETKQSQSQKCGLELNLSESPCRDSNANRHKLSPGTERNGESDKCDTSIPPSLYPIDNSQSSLEKERSVIVGEVLGQRVVGAVQTLSFPGRAQRKKVELGENVSGFYKRKEGYHYNISNQRRLSHNHNSCRSPCGIDLRHLQNPQLQSQNQKTSTLPGSVDVNSSINNTRTTDRERLPKKLEHKEPKPSLSKSPAAGQKTAGQKMDLDNSVVADEDSGHFDNGTGSGSNGSTFSESNTPLSGGSGSGNGSGGGGSGSSARPLPKTTTLTPLHDSRIEIAGGREIFSQNRTRVGRRGRGSSTMDFQPHFLQAQLLGKGSGNRRKVIPGPNPGSPRYATKKSPLGRDFSHQGTGSSSSVWELQAERKEEWNKQFGNCGPSRIRGRHYGGASCKQKHKSGNGGQLRARTHHHHQSFPIYDYYSPPNTRSVPLPRNNFSRDPIRRGSSPLLQSSQPRVHGTIKETMFGTEVTSVEKSLAYDETGRIVICDQRLLNLEPGQGSGQPKKGVVYSRGYDPEEGHLGGDIVFDDIEDWQEVESESGEIPEKEPSFSGSFSGSETFLNHPSGWERRLGTIVRDNDEKRKLSYTQIMESTSSLCPSIQVEGNTSPSGYESDEISASAPPAPPSHPNSFNENKRLIGNLPIAEYEGSPRRYGIQRQPPGPGLPGPPGVPTQFSNDLDLVDLCSSGVHVPMLSPQNYEAPATENSTDSQHSPILALNHTKTLSPNPGTTRLPGFPQRVHPHSENKLEPLPMSLHSNQEAMDFTQVHTQVPTQVHTQVPTQGHTQVDTIENSKRIPSTTQSGSTESKGTGSQNPLQLQLQLSSHEMSPGCSSSSQGLQLHSIGSSNGSGILPLASCSDELSLSREQCDYLYEFSETRKVLDEFFHSSTSQAVGRYPGGSHGNISPSDFDELDYTLRRQNGNSYVGQRLAGDVCLEVVEESPTLPPRRGGREVVMSLGIPDGEEGEFGTPSTRLITLHNVSRRSTSLSPVSKNSPPDDPGNRDVNDNDLDVETASTNTETDLGETEIGHQVRHHPRNYASSPETTDCDSNELESEMSLEYDVSVHSSSRVGTAMPVLEDGLSSGNGSDNDEDILEGRQETGEAFGQGHDSSSRSQVNPTLLLMKKQITEIEKEIQMRATTTTTMASSVGLVLGTVTNQEAGNQGGMSMSGFFLTDSGSSVPQESGEGGLEEGDLSGNVNIKVHHEMSGTTDRRSNSSSLFDCNDPELEALDPMRPTPPPSPAPSSASYQTHSHNLSSSTTSLRPVTSSISQAISPPKLSSLSLVGATSTTCSAMASTANGIHLSTYGTPDSKESISTQHYHHPHISCAEPLKLISSIMTPPDSSKEPLSHHRTKQYQLPKFDASSFTSLLPKPSSLTMTTAPVCPTQDDSPQSELHESSSEERLGPHGNSMSPVWVPRRSILRGDRNHPCGFGLREPFLRRRYEEIPDDDADTDQETDRLLGQHRTEDDYGFYNDKDWKKTKLRGILGSSGDPTPPHPAPPSSTSNSNGLVSTSSFLKPSSHVPVSLLPATTTKKHSSSPSSLLSNTSHHQPQSKASQNHHLSLNSPTAESTFPELPLSLPPSKPQKEKEGPKKKRNKEDLMKNPSVLIEGVLFRARYLGSTQLISEGQPTKATRMLQAEEAVSRIKAQANQNSTSAALSDSTVSLLSSSSSSITLPLVLSTSTTTDDEPNSPPTSPTRHHVNDNDDNSCPSCTEISSENDYNHCHSQQQDKCVSRTGPAELDLSPKVAPRPTECPTEHLPEDSSTFIVDNDDAFEFDSSIIFLGGQSPSDSCKSLNNSSTSSDGSGSGGPRRRLRIQQVPRTLSAQTGHHHPHPSNCSYSSEFHYCHPSCSGVTGTMFHLRFIGSLEVEEEVGSGINRRKRAKKVMVEEVVVELKAPDGETQPSTEVDLFISTEKIMVLNTDLKEIMMDHALRTISYIADIGDLVVLMARRRPVPTDTPEELSKIHRPPKMICHVFESDEAQYIAQSIGQAFQVAYMEFLKANGIEDHSFVREMDYQEVLNSQEIFGDELQMFAKKELQKDVVVPKAKGEILGVVIVESGWGSMLPTVVIANLAPAGAAARCGQLNIGDQIIAINGVSLVGLPLSTCQTYIKNSKTQTVVKLTVVPCPPVVEVKIKRPDTKYQLGFSVQNGVICSLLRGGIAERGGVRVGHRIIEINNQSVVAVPHEKIVNLLATSVGEINMKTMPTSMFRLLTGQETPLYI